MTGYEIIANRDGVELPTFLVEAETAHAAIEIARTIFGDTAGITLEQPDRVRIEVEDDELLEAVVAAEYGGAN